MINLTDLDLRYMDHAARVARVNREGWRQEASAPAGGSRTRELATVGSTRRHLIGAVVGIGERLRRTPADHAANLATTRYTQDVVR